MDAANQLWRSEKAGKSGTKRTLRWRQRPGGEGGRKEEPAFKRRRPGLQSGGGPLSGSISPQVPAPPFQVLKGKTPFLRR